MASASVEPHSPKDKLPVAPEGLRNEVKQLSEGSVKLRHTEVVEKLVLPTEEDIQIEKHQQCNTPILGAVSAFDRKSLRHAETEEKNPLPSTDEYKQIKHEKQVFRDEINNFDATKLKHSETEQKNALPSEAEYKQIKHEKEVFRNEISSFDKDKLKHVQTDEKPGVAAIDEAGDK